MNSAMKPNAFVSWIAAIAVAGSSAFAGTGSIFVNNYDANGGMGCPIYQGDYDYQLHRIVVEGLAPDDGMTQVMLFVNWNIVARGVIAGESGYFDFGVVDTGVADNTSAVFTLRAWRGNSESTYPTAFDRNAELTWTQVTGIGSAGSPPSLPQPTSLTFGGVPGFGLSRYGIFVIPEPTTVTLGILGGLALFARRRFKYGGPRPPEVDTPPLRAG
ncbi:MAG: hypothetical protein HZA89_02440 [Verrucomicrobia bacterium]|nr:hypothetical protein [Verrucomicrobiota bacterium]